MSRHVFPDQTVYRFYVDMQAPEDELLSVYGNSQSNLIVNAPMEFTIQWPMGWAQESIPPFWFFPDLADDTYATIGLDGRHLHLVSRSAGPRTCGGPRRANPTVLSCDGATTLSSTGSIGSSWYVTIGAENGRPQDGDLRVLIMQVNTAGDISGQINFELYPSWLQGQSPHDLAWHSTGQGHLRCVRFELPGCASELACNYDPNADALALYGCCTRALLVMTVMRRL